jgi:hypothetical protein
VDFAPMVGHPGLYFGYATGETTPAKFAGRLPIDDRDLGMVQRREDLRFAREAGQAIGAASQRVRQHFDRDFAFQLRVADATTSPIPLLTGLEKGALPEFSIRDFVSVFVSGSQIFQRLTALHSHSRMCFLHPTVGTFVGMPFHNGVQFPMTNADASTPDDKFASLFSPASARMSGPCLDTLATPYAFV